MKYTRPELFQIGSLEANTFGGNKNASQDSCDEYRSGHGDTLSIQASFQDACRKADEVALG